MQSGRQTNLHNTEELIPIKVDILQIQVTNAVHAGQTHDNERRGNELRNDGRSRRTGDTPIECNDEQHITADVKHTGKQQKVQRSARITDRAQDGRAKVIDHGRGHADKVQTHVQRGLIDDLFRGCHERQHGTRSYNTQHNQNQTTGQTGQERGLYGLLGVAVLTAAAKARDQHVCADRNTDKEVDQQVNE